MFAPSLGKSGLESVDKAPGLVTFQPGRVIAIHLSIDSCALRNS